MPKHSELVRKHRQHHVWQEYLRSWTRDGGIYCLREHRIFRTGTSALAVERDFYKLPEWTIEDLQAIKQTFLVDDLHPLLRDLHATVLDRPAMLALLQHWPALANAPPEVDQLLETFRTNFIEDYHAMIESDFLPILPRLLDGDVSWYENGAECIPFLVFLCAQYMRTKGMKERSIQDVRAVDLTRTWDVVALLMAQRVAWSFYADRRIRTPTIIRNKSATPFITSDQPVINICGGKRGTAPDAMSIYYPLSPELALYLGEPGEAAGIGPPDQVTAEGVGELNIKIAKAAHSQIFAHLEAPLRDIVSDVLP
jgi:hypothetical protein